MTDSLWPEDDVSPFAHVFDQAAVRSEDAEAPSFRAFILRHNPTLLDFEHVPRLASVGERIVTGELTRVLVLMAPRYFKSEVFSRLLPAYFLTRRPDAMVGLASYGADLAWSLSEEARMYFQGDGGSLRPETTSKKRWRTSAGGGMWAAGVGGPLLGFGYHLGIVDDPTDPEKAHSPTYQRRFGEWWPGKFLSRQEPAAAIVVVMQRLGAEDPIDFLYRREMGSEDIDCAPEHWHVVVCDEKKSPAPLGEWTGPQGLPPTCTLEPDPRTEGQVLAPSRYSPDQVAQLQQAAGVYVCGAQRQQRPAVPTGDFWQAAWFNTYDELPTDAYNGGWDWDLAYTKNEANSASAGIQSYRGPGPADRFRIYVNDVDWDWLQFPELLDLMRTKGPPYYIEAKASGKSAAQTLRREMVPVQEVTVAGDKFTRATGAQPVVSAGRIFVRKAIARRLLKGERQGLLRVTAEALRTDQGDLDVNDAFVQMINRHTVPVAQPFAFAL